MGGQTFFFFRFQPTYFIQEPEGGRIVEDFETSAGEPAVTVITAQHALLLLLKL